MQETNQGIGQGATGITFETLFQGNSDPASPAQATDTFQTAVNLNSSGSAGVQPLTSPQWGDFMSIAVQPSISPCTEDDASPTNYACTASTFWPFWLETAPSSDAGVQINDRSVTLTNP